MTTIHTTAPRSGQTTYHRDGTVTLWDCVRQEWTRTDEPRDELMATLGDAERERVIRHTSAD